MEFGTPSADDVTAGAFRLFVGDVHRSLTAWARDPRLPAVALAIAMLIVAPVAISADTGQSGFGLLSLAPALYFAGFYGTERIWYVRVNRGLPFSWQDLRVLNGQLRRRFARLGVLAGCLFVVSGVPIILATGTGSATRAGLTGLVAVILDVALTFATVGLAFNEGTAREALRHSLHVLRAQWPQCAWYALTPPLAIQVVSQLLPRSTLSLPSRFALDFTIAVFALLCKGATVLFYADRYPTLDDPSRELLG